MLNEETRLSAVRERRTPNLLGTDVERPRREVDALRMLLVRPDLVESFDVTPSLFRDPAVREVVGALRAAAVEGRKLHAATLADGLEDASARALVLELAAEETEYDDLEEEFSDSMRRIEERMLRRRK